MALTPLYDALPDYARDLFEERAQQKIYPDLRRTYAAHKGMIRLLGRTLYELERLAEQVFAIDCRKSKTISSRSHAFIGRLPCQARSRPLADVS
jgi:hypothetical protein